MRAKRQTWIAMLFCWLAVSKAAAEIHECDGVWTNKVCAGTSKSGMVESPLRATDLKKVEPEKKKAWLHDLEMLRLKAKKDFEIEVRIDGVRELCSQSVTSLTQCNKLISDKEFEINQLMLEAKKVKSNSSSSSEKSESKTENTTVIRQDRVVVVRGRRDPFRLRPPSSLISANRTPAVGSSPYASLGRADSAPNARHASDAIPEPSPLPLPSITHSNRSPWTRGK